jgi:hypothetical protein
VSFQITCVQCGEPAYVPALEVSYESHGDPTDAMWLCQLHRSSMKSLLGTPSSPGRPPKPRTAVDRARALVHHHRRRSQQSAAPRMVRPTELRPGSAAPKMPKIGPWT